MALGVHDRSEIRDSEKSALLKRVTGRRYNQYLTGMKLVKLRSYDNVEIRFDFPVTALVGPNGGGKTTALGAAALINENIKPRQFFAKGGAYDTSMVDWKIEYDLVEQRRSLKRTASYPKSKWNRDAVQRETAVFGVLRTLPATERKELSKFIGSSFRGFGEEPLTEETAKAVERILGKEASNYLSVAGDRSNSKSLFAARIPEGNSYSEFHFGAGEASIINIISKIEKSPDESLILIEEIENGLHPVATRRLVEYLISVARRKSCQVIFTTHSNDALSPLPDEAVWSCGKGELTQGKLDVNALRTLTGEVKASAAIFVEDRFGEEMALTALRVYAKPRNIPLLGIAIHAVGGHGQVAKFTTSQNSNPAIMFDAIGIVDGDMRSEANPEKRIACFPGDDDPETHVANAVLSIIETVAARLALNMGLTTQDQARVAEVVRDKIRTNADRHVLFEQIGEDLDFISGLAVERAFLTQWAENFPEEIEAMFDPVADVLGNVVPSKGDTEDAVP